MAAACLFHIVRNHPFVDGAERAGVMAAFTFLELNGLALRAPGRALEKVVLSVAGGKTGKAAVAEFFRKHTRKS